MDGDKESTDKGSTVPSQAHDHPRQQKSVAVSEDTPGKVSDVRSQTQDEPKSALKHQNALTELDTESGISDAKADIQPTTGPTPLTPGISIHPEDVEKDDLILQKASDPMDVDDGEGGKGSNGEAPQSLLIEAPVESMIEAASPQPSEVDEEKRLDAEGKEGANAVEPRGAIAKKRLKKPKVSTSVGKKRSTRRSGRIQTRHTTDGTEDLVSSSLSDPGVSATVKVELSTAELLVEEQKKGKIPELEKLTRGVFLKDIPWPVAGRVPFAPLGSLPPNEMKRLARKAGAAHAPHVVYYTSHEVGQVCLAHMWRKKTQECKGLEELLFQIRIFESFLDKPVSFKMLALFLLHWSLNSRLPQCNACLGHSLVRNARATNRIKGSDPKGDLVHSARWLHWYCTSLCREQKSISGLLGIFRSS
jgi:hypothetical protein